MPSQIVSDNAVVRGTSVGLYPPGGSGLYPPPTPDTSTYLRPGGVDTYLRPGGVDAYLRP